ncbi:hypothetical protein JTB14_006269 [Gonioctena quinquepunctata]|nr:hypothetical protein JTB14_006269 [Gonioctena quinquepunctata]
MPFACGSLHRKPMDIPGKCITTCITGNMITFATGTALTWPSPILDKLKNDTDINMSEEQGTWVTSLFHLGAVFGPLPFGFLADLIGRKFTLLSLGIPFTVCYLLMAFVKLIPIFYIARFMIGVMVGGVYTVIPMYLSEIGDHSNRGVLSSMMGVFICSGMLFSYAVGPYVSILVFNLTLAVFPAVFTVAFLFIASETPQFLIKKGKPEEARRALQKFRGPGTNIEEELSAMEESISGESGGSFADIFKSKGNSKAFLIGVGLVGFQQISGINAVLAYAQNIFENAGTSLDPAICSIIVGVVQWFSSLTTPLFIERLGRKAILLISAAGIVAAEVPLGVYSYLQDHDVDVSSFSIVPIICLVVYIFVYTSGMGPLPWTVSSELFAHNIKSKASALITMFAAVVTTCGWLIALNISELMMGCRKKEPGTRLQLIINRTENRLVAVDIINKLVAKNALYA